MGPNPVAGSTVSLWLNLTGKASKIRVALFTASGRKICEFERTAQSGGWFEGMEFELDEAAGSRLANGTYHFLVAVYDGEQAKDRKAGSLFVLR